MTAGKISTEIMDETLKNIHLFIVQNINLGILLLTILYLQIFQGTYRVEFIPQSYQNFALNDIRD